MLTADLVQTRRRGGELHLVRLSDETRARAVALAETLIGHVNASVGRSLDDLELLFDATIVEARDYRLKDGLAKLLFDRCEWDAAATVDPEALRAEVFTLASALRAASESPLDRATVLAQVGLARGMTDAAVDDALFADLKGREVLSSLDPIDAETLVLLYERSQAQAVLLRAVTITADVESSTAGATRALFRRLKFLQLLHTVERTETGYRIVIDGPFSLFESVTKYGQKLAMVLPALEDCDAWQLTADVRWGKERAPLVFRLQGSRAGTRTKEPPLPDDVLALKTAFEKLGTAWRVAACKAVLDLPGVGLTVPDLVFTREAEASRTPARVYLEVMGYWSRAAVWKRVELVQAGLGERVLFAVSSRLRVSEEVLPAELPGALYVYKGTMSARVVLERIEALAAR